uniref:SMAD family member 3 n=1 Tax=Macaca nemestrina TaxID=9545 RepID=A0A2K6C3Y6_MACNE
MGGWTPLLRGPVWRRVRQPMEMGQCSETLHKCGLLPQTVDRACVLSEGQLCPWMAGCRCPIGRGSLMSSTAACGDGRTCTATTSCGPWSCVSSPSI